MTASPSPLINCSPRAASIFSKPATHSSYSANITPFSFSPLSENILHQITNFQTNFAYRGTRARDIGRCGGTRGQETCPTGTRCLSPCPTLVPSFPHPTTKKAGEIGMLENEMKKGHKPPGTPAKKAKKLFIQEMNTKAQQIGLTRSRFVEPAGFPSTTEQVMSTRDMLKLMIYASRYQE